MAPLLHIRDLNVQFATPAGPAHAVCALDLTIAPGEVVGLVGESGSGKSVTSLAVMRLLPPQAQMSGEILFAGRDLLKTSEGEMRRLRGAGIAMIFQEPMTALNPVMRIGDQIAEAVLAHSQTPTLRFAQDGAPAQDGVPDHAQRINKAEAWKRAVEALRVVAIPEPDRRARDYPHQLSGGMRQRVMIAMAVANNPKLLIADEPTTALDVTIQAQILDLLASLRQRFGLAMLFISHDLAVVSQVADRIAVMYAGSLVELGSRHDVFCRPAHPYTRGLLHAVPTLATDRRESLHTIEGSVPSPSAQPAGCLFEPRCELRQSECLASRPALIELTTGHFARCPVSDASHSSGE